MASVESLNTEDNDADFNNFVTLHRSQLETSVIPEATWPTLWRKLREEIFDAGETFIFGRVASQVCANS